MALIKSPRQGKTAFAQEFRYIGLYIAYVSEVSQDCTIKVPLENRSFINIDDKKFHRKSGGVSIQYRDCLGTVIVYKERRVSGLMASKTALEAEIKKLKEDQKALMAKMDTMQTSLIAEVVKATLKAQSKSDPIQDELIWKLRRTRKDFVCRKILDLARDRKELAELKYLVVDQAKFCLKATFYRYIDELTKKGMLTMASFENKVFAKS